VKSLSTNLGGFFLSWIIVVLASAAFEQDTTGVKQSVMGQSSRRRVSAFSVTTENTSEFFGLRVGSRWVYEVSGKREEGSGKNVRILPVHGSYSEKIVAMHDVGLSVRLVEFAAEGVPYIYGPCSDDFVRKSGNHEEMRFWYIVARNQIFSSCTQEEANQMARSLSASPSGKSPDDDPEYLLPFKVGAFWGADPSGPKRTDFFYQWNVEAKQDLTLPAGRFKGCYELNYRTLPDNEYKWVCSGAGLVADEYQHHGTVDKYRIELQSHTSGPIAPAQ
jgi:hypothetical protein